MIYTKLYWCGLAKLEPVCHVKKEIIISFDLKDIPNTQQR